MATATQSFNPPVTTGTAVIAQEKKPDRAEPERRNDDVPMGFATAASFALLQRGAAMLAASGLMPKQFAGNVADCALVLNMAQRMDADPLMVAQNLYVVYGRPGWSSKFLIATFNKSGRYEPIDYEFCGEPGTDGYGCRAFSTVKITGKRLVGPWITIKLAKAEGWYDRKSKEGAPASKWPTMTELMLMYRSAAWFINTHAPEIAMGLRTAEEEMDIGPVMEEVYERTSERLKAEREQAIANAVQSAPSKLDAVVDADKAKGNGKEQKAAADAAMAEAKEKLQQKAKREAKPASKPLDNPNYAEGSDPDPFQSGMFREPGQEG